MAARRIADEIADGIAERDPRPEGFLGRRLPSYHPCPVT